MKELYLNYIACDMRGCCPALVSLWMISTHLLIPAIMEI